MSTRPEQLPQSPAVADRPAEKLHGIEILRFGAAFAVLLAHYNHFYIQGLVPVNYVLEAQPLFAYLRPFYLYGTRAVEVFWCVSGFIFFHQYGRAISRRVVPAGRFFWLRFSRLYPLHLITLLAVALLQWGYLQQQGSCYVVALNDLKHFVLNLFFASHWGLQSGFSFNAPVWSVSLEILVYAFFFISTWLLRVDYFMTLLWLGGCVLLNHLLGYEGVFVRCLFYFYAGGLSCLCYRSLADRLPRYRLMFAAGAAALLIGCGLRFSATHDLDLWVLDLGTPLALLLAALISHRLTGPVARLSAILGNLTYASYLIHFPLQLAIMLIVGLAGIEIGFAASPWFLVTYLLLVLILARCVYVWLELPAQKYLRRQFIKPVAPNPACG